MSDSQEGRASIIPVTPNPITTKVLNDSQVTSKATNFFDSVKNEVLPTPKKQSTAFEATLI
jgi:hypothetical protein